MTTEVTDRYTVEDYVLDRTRFKVPPKALRPIFLDRGVDGSALASGTDRDTLRLCYADLLKWIVLGASKVNNTSDSDNGWSHSGGGFEIDAEDRKLLVKEANAIYNELDPSSVIKSKSTFRMISFGVRHASYDTEGNPLPHIIK